jgi:hypothetical protein
VWYQTAGWVLVRIGERNEMDTHRLRNGDIRPDDTWSRENMAFVAPLSRIVKISAIISRLGDARSPLRSGATREDGDWDALTSDMT